MVRGTSRAAVFIRGNNVNNAKPVFIGGFFFSPGARRESLSRMVNAEVRLYTWNVKRKTMAGRFEKLLCLRAVRFHCHGHANLAFLCS